MIEGEMLLDLFLKIAPSRWSVGGFSRRWGPDAKRPLRGGARDFTLASLCTLAAAAAGPRLRALPWMGALLPGDLVRVLTRMPFGDVIEVTMELMP